MPLGAFRLNSLARYIAPSIVYRPTTITSIGESGIGSGFASSTTQKQFGTASAYSNGSNKYLTLSDIPLGSGNWTIEFWFRADSTTATRTLIDFRSSNGNNTQLKPTIYLSGTKIYYYVNGAIRAQSTYYNASAGTWYHAAIVKNNGTVTVYFRGYYDNASLSQYSDSNDYGTGPAVIGVNAAQIGQNGAVQVDDYAGYIDEVRISKVARYTTTFFGAEPTTAFVNDANTLFLMHTNQSANSTNFADDTGVRHQMSVLAANGAQVDTAQSKFGGASLLCDGTTDYLDTETTNILTFGTGQYTVECWLRLSSTGKQHSFFDLRAGGNDWVLYVTSGNRLEIYTGSTGTSSTTLSANTWYHVALVRDSTNLKVYLNGSQTISLTAPNITSNRRLRIGGGRDGASYPNTDLAGWMDEIRISNVARYTSNFTVPSTAFTNDSNTLLLLHCNGVDATKDFIDDNT